MAQTLDRYQAADLAGMRVQGIDYHIEKKSFAARRVGHRIVIDGDSFEKWLEARKTQEQKDGTATG